MQQFLTKTISIFVISSLLILALPAQSSLKNEKVFQINLDKVLNARSVSTFTNVKITTWNIGIDGNGEADGYLTMNASLFMGDKDPKALPDNPLFPATAKHPEVLLHYSNTDSASSQTVALKGAASVEFEVPSNKYSKLFLAFTSAEGNSQIKVDLTYADGSESKPFDVPDYYLDITANDPNACSLAHNLAKWGKQNNMTESDHHNIDLLDIHPNANRVLKSIKIVKSEAAYLVLWAATGVVKI